jgi:hypothetical protein
MKIMLGLLWVSFLLFWVYVYASTASRDMSDSVSYLGVMLAGYGIALAAWVYHNVRIWRKKGPRRGGREVSDVVTRDSLRRVILHGSDVKLGRDIRVTVEGASKLFSDRSGLGISPTPGFGETPPRERG